MIPRKNRDGVASEDATEAAAVEIGRFPRVSVLTLTLSERGENICQWLERVNADESECTTGHPDAYAMTLRFGRKSIWSWLNKQTTLGLWAATPPARILERMAM